MLIRLLTSCKTNERSNEELTVIVPSLVFPEFPLLEGAYLLNDNETVVPNSFIFNLAEYKILINETEKNYNDIKSLYEEGSKE